MHERIPAIGWLGFVIVAALASSCASGASTGNMVIPRDALPAPPTDLALAQKLRVTSVSGGKDTNPMVAPEIGDSNFRTALEQSLLSAGLLAPPSFSPKYLLEAEVLKYGDSNPSPYDATVTMTVDYRLKEASTGTLVWEYSISTPYTVRFSDAWDGSKRLRLALEGAARGNIKELIDTLYQIGSARLDV